MPPNDAKVAPAPVAVHPPRPAAAVAPRSPRSAVPAASPRPAAKAVQAPPQPPSVRGPAVKAPAEAPATQSVKPSLAMGGRSATAAGGQAPIQPTSRAASAGMPKLPPVSSERQGAKATTRVDAPTNAAPGRVAAPQAAKETKKVAPLDLDSLPPPAQASRPTTRMDGEDEVDEAFLRVTSTVSTPSNTTGSLVVDPVVKEQNAELFRQMAVGFARPLRDFMLELVLGPTTKQWIEIARRPVENLLKGARELELSEFVDALLDFDIRLGEAQNAHGSRITGAERERLLSCYEALVKTLPMAFDLKSERDRREPIVVHQLLLQVPGVHKVAIDKLYAAGLASLDGLCRSTADDLMALAHLDREGAEAIIRRFQAYLRERTEQVLEKGEVQAKQKLRAIVDKLGKAHLEFQRAEVDEDRERKRRARNERRSRTLEMNVLLAQLGEIELVADLERSATERRIERVRGYIESSGRAEPARQEVV